MNRAAVDIRWASTVLKLNPNESNHRLILQFKQGSEIIYGNQAPSVYFPSQFLPVHSNLTVPAYFNGKLTNSFQVIRLVQNKVNKYVHHIALKQPQYFEVIQKLSVRLKLNYVMIKVEFYVFVMETLLFYFIFVQGDWCTNSS